MMKEKLLYTAINIATKAHKKQTDKYGAPYLGHVMRVMNSGKTMDEKILGVLHDVVEDCPEYTLDFFRNQGFPEHIVFALQCISKISEEESYDDFIQRIEQSPLAIAVKINDLKDNMDISRSTCELTSKDLKRLNKYLKAYLYLTEKY